MLIAWGPGALGPRFAVSISGTARPAVGRPATPVPQDLMANTPSRIAPVAAAGPRWPSEDNCRARLENVPGAVVWFVVGQREYQSTGTNVYPH